MSVLISRYISDHNSVTTINANTPAFAFCVIEVRSNKNCALYTVYLLVSTIDIVSSQLYVCHILVSKKCQLQAGTIHPRPLA